MFESREKFPGWDKPRENTSRWSYDMEGYARKCVRTVLRIGKQEDSATLLSFSSLLGRSPNQKGELSEVCFHIVLRSLYLAELST